MTAIKDNVINLEEVRLSPELIAQYEQVGYRPSNRPRQAGRRFVQVPWVWVVTLAGAHGRTWHLALVLLYLHWKGDGAPITLANCTVKGDGIPPQSKRRALHDLERRGLVRVDWRASKSPIVRILVSKA